MSPPRADTQLMGRQANTKTSELHPFARAGFVAPYTLAGFSGPLEGSFAQYDFGHDSGALVAFEPQFGGSCDVCGMAIIDMTHFVDATGRAFKVGCDCAMLADLDSDEIEQIRADQKAAARARRNERSRPEREAAIAAWNAKRAAGKSALDALDWEFLSQFAHEDYWTGKTAADEIRAHIKRQGPARAADVANWASQILAECVSGERDAAIEPAPKQASEAHKAGRQTLELRIFSILTGETHGATWRLVKMVDRAGRQYLTFGVVPDAINELDFTAVKATAASAETNKYTGAQVAKLSRIALVK